MDTLNLDDYKLYNRNRLGRPGGGVCLYVDSGHSVNICDDLIIEDGHSDSLFIEINVKNGKNLIVGVIYRPPDSDFDTFKTKLDAHLNCINRNDKNCFILGDFNVDISKEDKTKDDFINTLYSSSFFPTINTFIRVTESSRTIIDNIITNIQNARIDSGLILSDITDNFPIVLFIDLVF